MLLAVLDVLWLVFLIVMVCIAVVGLGVVWTMELVLRAFLELIRHSLPTRFR